MTVETVVPAEPLDLAYDLLALGAKTVTHLQVTLDEVDVSCHAWAPLLVQWGRGHPGDSFEPRRATITFDDIVQPRRGQTMVATLQDPTANPIWRNAVGTWAAQVGTWQSKRVDIVVFRGKITDVTATWDFVWVNREAKPRWGAVYDVVAVDPMAELANLVVGDVPWPQESVTSRATRIEALTPLVWANDPSGALVAARDVDAQPAYDLLDDLAHMASLAGGLFYDPNGNVARFILDAQRTSNVPDVVIDACTVDSDAKSSVTAVDVVNDVTVTYVNPADTSAQPAAHYVNTGSVGTFGRRQRTISTQLVTATDAAKRASAEAARFGLAVESWEGVKIGTKWGSASSSLAKSLLLAGPGMRAQLTKLPKPATTPWDGYLEGWALEVDATSWAVELMLSPAVWTGPLMTWQQVTPTQRWVDIVKPWTWNDALSALPMTVPEPGFEHWTTDAPTTDYPTGRPIGWELFWLTGARRPAQKGPAHDGAFGLQWGPTTALGQSNRLMSGPAWPTQQGQVITCGIWARCTDITKPGAIQLDMMTAPHSNPQPFGPNTAGLTALPSTPLTDVWTYYSGSVVVPAGHTYARFTPLVQAGAVVGATIQIDSAQAQ